MKNSFSRLLLAPLAVLVLGSVALAPLAEAAYRQPVEHLLTVCWAGFGHERQNRTLKTARRQDSSRPAPSREVVELRARLAEAEETLRAIRTGEVDAVVVQGERGPQVFTLDGAEHAYRVLIESMNEGALPLTPDLMVLYANRCFARMVKCPLEQVVGNSFRRFLPSKTGPRSERK